MADSVTTALRDNLLDWVDLSAATSAANEIEAIVHERFNSMTELGVASSIIARALLVRGVANVAGAWLADVTGISREQGNAVVAEIVQNGLPGVREHMLHKDGI